MGSWAWAGQVLPSNTQLRPRQGQEKSPGGSTSASEHPALGRWPPGPPSPPEVRSVHGLPWGSHSLLVDGRFLVRGSPRDSLFCPSLCSTNHALPFIPSLPAPAGSPLSISCHVFPVLQTTGRGAQLGLLPNRGERLDASLTVLSQALQRGQLGAQSHWAGCGGGPLKRTPHLCTHAG